MNCYSKLWTSIDNTYLFSNFTPLNLNFESSFVGICQIFMEIWLFVHEFQNRNFGQFRIFRGIKFSNFYISFVFRKKLFKNLETIITEQK